MSSPYVYCYGPSQYEGNINGIEVRWQGVGKTTLQDQATLLQVPLETLKRMCEHFGYLLAYRTQSAYIIIDPPTFSERGDPCRVRGGTPPGEMCGVGDFGIDMGKEAGDVKEDFGERVDANWSKKKGYKKNVNYLCMYVCMCIFRPGGRRPRKVSYWSTGRAGLNYLKSLPY
jgi:hypothetical protein